MKGFNVEIKVGSLLKQYVENCLQDNIVKTGNGWVIVDLIKPYLILEPRKQLNLFEEKEEKDYSEIIMVEVPLLHCKTYSKQYNRIIHLDGLYHTVVSDYGQAVVRRHLKKIMRQAFHVYMDGYTSAYDELDKKRVKAGITSFLSDYNIIFTEKDISSLARDWFRYRDKKYGGRINPILF